MQDSSVYDRGQRTGFLRANCLSITLLMETVFTMQLHTTGLPDFLEETKKLLTSSC